MVDLRWTGTVATLEAALEALGWERNPTGQVARDPRVIAFGPVGREKVAGQLVGFALIRATERIEPPEGIFEEDGASHRGVTGVFMEGTARARDPRDWMDRIPLEKQLAVCGAALQSPVMLRMLLRMAAGTINLDSDETKASVAGMVDAGLISEEDAQALLA